MQIRSEVIAEVARIYSERSFIPFDGATYLKDVLRDIEVIEAICPERDGPICDIGCGAGWHLEELANAGYSRLTGIDICAKTLRLARLRIGKRNGTRLRLMHRELTRWHPRESFSLVTCFLACTGVGSSRDGEAFVKSLRRICGKNGRLIVSAFCREDIADLVGRVEKAYAANDGSNLLSEVSVANGGSSIVIEQTAQMFSENRKLIETLRLPRRTEFAELLRSVGFGQISIRHRIHCGRTTFVGFV